MEILNPDEMAARQGAPAPTAPQAPRPSLVKRFAIPVGVAVGAVALAVTAIIVTPRTEPEASAPAAESAPAALASSLSPWTQAACFDLDTFRNAYDRPIRITQLRYAIEQNPEKFSPGFEPLVVELAIYLTGSSDDADEADAALIRYCER
jgi:hypothetical protein